MNSFPNVIFKKGRSQPEWIIKKANIFNKHWKNNEKSIMKIIYNLSKLDWSKKILNSGMTVNLYDVKESEYLGYTYPDKPKNIYLGINEKSRFNIS